MTLSGTVALPARCLGLLPDKHMIRMIMELVRNRSFTLTTGDSKQSRLRRLKNGVPQGSVLAPLLFNIYTYDLPSMISRKFAYAHDLALEFEVFWKLEELGGDFKPRHVYTFSVSPDLEVEAQSH